MAYEYIVEAANQMFTLLTAQERTLRDERHDLMEVIALGAMTLDMLVRDREVRETTERLWQRRREPERNFETVIEDTQSLTAFLNGERELLVSSGMDAALVDQLIDKARRDASNIPNIHPEALSTTFYVADSTAYQFARLASEELLFEAPTPLQQILLLQSQQQAIQQQMIALYEQQVLLHRQIEALQQQDRLEQRLLQTNIADIDESTQYFLYMQTIPRWLRLSRRRRESIQRQEQMLEQQGRTLQQVQEELHQTRQILQETQAEQSRLLERFEQQQGEMLQGQAEGEYEQSIDVPRRHARTVYTKVCGVALVAFNVAVDVGTLPANFGTVPTPTAVMLSIGLGINWISD